MGRDFRSHLGGFKTLAGEKTPSVPPGQLPHEWGSGVSQLLPLPLPHSWGIGVYADAAEGGEGALSSPTAPLKHPALSQKRLCALNKIKVRRGKQGLHVGCQIGAEKGLMKTDWKRIQQAV